MQAPDTKHVPPELAIIAFLDRERRVARLRALEWPFVSMLGVLVVAFIYLSDGRRFFTLTVILAVATIVGVTIQLVLSERKLVAAIDDVIASAELGQPPHEHNSTRESD